MTLSDQILNDGLELHIEFGENWLADIDNRLYKKHSELTESDLRNADKLCRNITNNFIPELLTMNTYKPKTQ